MTTAPAKACPGPDDLERAIVAGALEPPRRSPAQDHRGPGRLSRALWSFALELLGQLRNDLPQLLDRAVLGDIDLGHGHPALGRRRLRRHAANGAQVKGPDRLYP